VLELAHLVVAGANRLIATLHDRAAVTAQRIAVEGRLELVLEVIFAAFDLVDDRLLVAAGDRRLQILEALVSLAEKGAVVLGVAAEPAHFGAEALDHLLSLVGALAEYLAEALIVDVLGAVLVASDAVDRRRN